MERKTCTAAVSESTTTMSTWSEGRTRSSAHPDERDHDRGHVGKSVDVERVDEVLDVEAALKDVEDLEDEGEERDAEKHHRGDVAAQGIEEELRLGAVLADFRL